MVTCFNLTNLIINLKISNLIITKYSIFLINQIFKIIYSKRNKINNHKVRIIYNKNLIIKMYSIILINLIAYSKTKINNKIMIIYNKLAINIYLTILINLIYKIIQNKMNYLNNNKFRTIYIKIMSN